MSSLSSSVLFTCVVAVSIQIIAGSGSQVVTPQIIGGTNSPMVPYFASLRSPTYNHICGGSIIKPLWVLTAAHCCKPLQNSTYVVVATNHLFDGSGWLYTIVQTITHESFVNSLGKNDIAVVKVNQPFAYDGTTVAAIALASGLPPTGTTCSVVGFGVTNGTTQTVPSTLQTVPLKTISNSACTKALPGTTIYTQNVCTQVQKGKGICYGDSGSPVVYQNNGNKQFALVQRVVPPCGTGQPDIHTSTSSYSAWITQKTV